MSARSIDASRDALITLRDANFERDGRMILDGVDFTIARGEIVTLIGPNGAGKSTLIKAALGLLALDSGTVERAAGLRVGYQPQRYALDRALPISVRRLVMLNTDATQERAAEVLAMLRITALADADVHRLSGGELQRVMLARAILRAPDLLVLDEPSQSLDVTGTVEIYDTIAALRRATGCGVLVVSHDLNVVRAATDRVYCLNGHVCCSGRPEDVSRNQAFLALFGPAAAALALYPHHHDHEHAPGAHHPGHGHHGHGHHHDHGR